MSRKKSPVELFMVGSIERLCCAVKGWVAREWEFFLRNFWFNRCYNFCYCWRVRLWLNLVGFCSFSPARKGGETSDAIFFIYNRTPPKTLKSRVRECLTRSTRTFFKLEERFRIRSSLTDVEWIRSGSDLLTSHFFLWSRGGEQHSNIIPLQ